MVRAGVGLFLATIVAAPLLAGAVHRSTLSIVVAFTGVALALLWVGIRFEHRELRIGRVVALPLVFLAIPALQSIPLPMGVRGLLDSKGTQMLADYAFITPGAWPLSLDPSSTRAHIARAAAALATFLVAYHLASGHKRRYHAVRAIAIAGIAAVVVGVGHKIFGIHKIYGILVSTHRTLLTGPFVNSNHTAELLEIAAFACLACAVQRATALNRVGWLVGTVLCAGGAMATLSRGAVLGMAAGGFVFAVQRYVARDRSAPQRWKGPLVWAALVVGLVVLAGAALGAGKLLDRFRSDSVGGDLRFRLWRDSLGVLAAHPLGIGRGAFERVFPIYRTVTTEYPTRFAFVENHPLQLLIDAGWVAFAILAATTLFTAWRVVRHGRRDAIEAALVAGLFAVLIHNVVDFGLETLGVLLPFVAILGTVLGRATTDEEPSIARKWPIAACAGIGIVVGTVSLAHGSYDDFDKIVKDTPATAVRRDVLARAQRVHPLDYYARSYARLEPLRSASAGPSPRFRALNRALALCQICEPVHVEVARNLWVLGLRSQALMEWRAAIAIQPQLLPQALGELFAGGAKAEELASIAAPSGARMIEVAGFLASISHVEEATTVLDQAEALGVAGPDVLLTRARLQLQAGKAEAAAATLARVRASGVTDTRLALLDAQLCVARDGAQGAARALAILDDAAARNPVDLRVQRLRLEIVTKFEKWQVADRALDGFKHALYHNGGSVAEAHLAAARIHTRLSRWTTALGEFRIALADQGNNPALWMEYGSAAEAAGRLPTAREAYAQAARLSPGDPNVANAAKRLQQRLHRTHHDLSDWPGGSGAP